MITFAKVFTKVEHNEKNYLICLHIHSSNSSYGTEKFLWKIQ